MGRHGDYAAMSELWAQRAPVTYGEVKAIGDMVESTEHRHMSIRGLALLAQRVGKVFAHPGT